MYWLKTADICSTNDNATYLLRWPKFECGNTCYMYTKTTELIIHCFQIRIFSSFIANRQGRRKPLVGIINPKELKYELYDNSLNRESPACFLPVK